MLTLCVLAIIIERWLWSLADRLYACDETTAVVAVYNRLTNQLTVANCGDARCVLNKGGRAHDMSIDHKPEVAEEKQRIEHAGRRVIDNR